MGLPGSAPRDGGKPAEKICEGGDLGVRPVVDLGTKKAALRLPGRFSRSVAYRAHWFDARD